jgi:hypothetical protein
MMQVGHDPAVDHDFCNSRKKVAGRRIGTDRVRSSWKLRAGVHEQITGIKISGRTGLELIQNSFVAERPGTCSGGMQS